jgi:hypothetical protein
MPDRHVGVAPVLVPRGRRAAAEATKDLIWLRWIGRFRFVTAELAAARFDVSVQKARRRLGRLTGAQLVKRHPSGFGMPALFVLAPRGAKAVGYPPRRRAPRPELHRIHELAIVSLVTDLELAAGPSVDVLTERECRWRSSANDSPYAVEVADQHGERHLRWADVVVVTPTAKVAVEIELAPKHSARLAHILTGYLLSDFTELRFLVALPSLAQRIATIDADRRIALGISRHDPAPRTVIDAWAHASDSDRAAIRRSAGESAPATA